MSNRRLIRFGLAALVASLLAGCASARPASECQRNRNQCLYEGAYESGERAYAEDAARRLNQAQLARLRRGW